MQLCLYLLRNSIRIEKPSYNVTLDAMGGDVSPSRLTVYYDGTYGTLPTPIRSGYTFNGWFTSSGSKVTSNSEIVSKADHTLYAEWTGNDDPSHFIFPAFLISIEEETFAGGAFGYVHIPEQVTTIGAKAFANVSGLTIHGVDGSYAKFYASKNGFSFVPDYQ